MVDSRIFVFLDHRTCCARCIDNASFLLDFGSWFKCLWRDAPTPRQISIFTKGTQPPSLSTRLVQWFTTSQANSRTDGCISSRWMRIISPPLGGTTMIMRKQGSHSFYISQNRCDVPVCARPRCGACRKRKVPCNGCPLSPWFWFHSLVTILKFCWACSFIK